MGRPDGKLVKDAELMYLFVPHIMKRRYDALNMLTLDIPVEPLHEYIKAKREEGIVYSHMDMILASYVRTVAEFPLLNRFIVNKRIYDRNELCVAMVVQKQGEDDGTISKIYFSPGDNLAQVHDKTKAFVESNNQGDESNSTDQIMEKLKGVPGLLGIGVAILKWLDKHGWMPKSVINASPFHATMLISNLASIRTNHVYHHIYDFGTISMVITMGNLREVAVREKDRIIHKRCIPLGVVIDERICSGHYMAQAFRLMKRCLSHPELMETGFSPKNDDNADKEER